MPDRDTMLRLTTTMNDRQISRIYGCDSMIVARWRDIHGIPRSPRQSGGNTTKWKTNRAFFSRVDTPARAYILGFLIADGHIHKEGYKIQVSVKEADGALLQAIADEMDCDAPLGTTINRYDGSRMTRLSLYGKQLVGDLGALGLDHDKSRTACWPTIPAGLESHLIRGLWDGDGHIGRGQFELVGTSALLDGVVASVKAHTGHHLTRYMGGRNAAYHYVRGMRRHAAVLDWMYADAAIALERKRQMYLLHWSQTLRAESLNLPVVAADRGQAGSAADYPSADTLF